MKGSWILHPDDLHFITLLVYPSLYLNLIQYLTIESYWMKTIP